MRWRSTGKTLDQQQFCSNDSRNRRWPSSARDAGFYAYAVPEPSGWPRDSERSAFTTWPQATSNVTFTCAPAWQGHDAKDDSMQSWVTSCPQVHKFPRKWFLNKTIHQFPVKRTTRRLSGRHPCQTFGREGTNEAQQW